MLTRGNADSLSRIRVSADAMEMEMAMTADGAAAPASSPAWWCSLLQRWLCKRWRREVALLRREGCCDVDGGRTGAAMAAA